MDHYTKFVTLAAMLTLAALSSLYMTACSAAPIQERSIVR